MVAVDIDLCFSVFFKLRFDGQGTCFFPECVAKGSRFTFGGLGVEVCSRGAVFSEVPNVSSESPELLPKY